MLAWLGECVCVFCIVLCLWVVVLSLRCWYNVYVVCWQLVWVWVGGHEGSDMGCLDCL